MDDRIEYSTENATDSWERIEMVEKCPGEMYSNEIIQLVQRTARINQNPLKIFELKITLVLEKHKLPSAAAVAAAAVYHKMEII